MTDQDRTLADLPADVQLALTGERTVPGIPAENYWFRRHEVAYQHILDRCAGRDILEAGSGEGYGAAMLAEVAASVTCVDYDESAVEHTRRRYAGLVVHQANLIDLPLADAISSYLFNSMLIQVPGESRLTLICPTETRDNPKSHAVAQGLAASNGPIGAVRYVDVRQSMRNGGGPACLRLRVVLTDAEVQAMHQGVLMNDDLYARLVPWVERHYRDRVEPKDLADPQLAIECITALEELERILGLPGLSFRDDDYYALHIFAQVLGGGLTSRLWQEVRETRGLAYEIQAFHWPFSDCGLFGIGAGTAPEDVAELIEVSLACLRRAAEDATEAEVADPITVTVTGRLSVTVVFAAIGPAAARPSSRVSAGDRRARTRWFSSASWTCRGSGSERSCSSSACVAMTPSSGSSVAG